MFGRPQSPAEPPTAITPAVRLLAVGVDGGLAASLSGAGGGAADWRVRTAVGPVAPERLALLRVNAVLVDLDSDRAERREYLERLCATVPELALIACASRSTVAERVWGLQLGMDTWIAKPCAPTEMAVRIEAVLRGKRRPLVERRPEAAVRGDLDLHSDPRWVRIEGAPIDLTDRELGVLRALAEADGRVLPRETIYYRVWGYAMAPGDRSVDVHVRRLRQKLGLHSPSWRYIHTHFGSGYRFEARQVEPSQSSCDEGAQRSMIPLARA